MPRLGNTRSRKAFHHKAMKSAAHGSGHSAKLRSRKRQDGREKCGYCKRPVRKPELARSGSAPVP
jgi:hypothetical protein